MRESPIAEWTTNILIDTRQTIWNRVRKRESNAKRRGEIRNSFHIHANCTNVCKFIHGMRNTQSHIKCVIPFFKNRTTECLPYSTECKRWCKLMQYSAASSVRQAWALSWNDKAKIWNCKLKFLVGNIQFRFVAQFFFVGRVLNNRSFTVFCYGFGIFVIAMKRCYNFVPQCCFPFGHCSHHYLFVMEFFNHEFHGLADNSLTIFTLHIPPNLICAVPSLHTGECDKLKNEICYACWVHSAHIHNNHNNNFFFSFPTMQSSFM